jgi:hypothetical protein
LVRFRGVRFRGLARGATNSIPPVGTQASEHVGQTT